VETNICDFMVYHGECRSNNQQPLLLITTSAFRKIFFFSSKPIVLNIFKDKSQFVCKHGNDLNTYSYSMTHKFWGKCHAWHRI